MRFHSQNLNEKSNNRMGSMFRHGRCWWSVMQFGARIEWSFGHPQSIGFSIDLADYDDDAISAHISMGWPGAIYWGFQNPRLRRIMERITSRDSAPRPLGNGRTYWSTNGRSIGVRWFEGTLWIDLWNDPMESRSTDPKWWHITITPLDVLFGRTTYEEIPIARERVTIPMPEGGYPATVEIFESVWRRKRWPGAWHRKVRSTITPDAPIPFPGKGESGWDCGEDATHSMTGAHETGFDAAMALSRSVMRDRVRHGGWNYVPEKMRT